MSFTVARQQSVLAINATLDPGGRPVAAGGTVGGQNFGFSTDPATGDLTVSTSPAATNLYGPGGVSGAAASQATAVLSSPWLTIGILALVFLAGWALLKKVF